MNEQILMENPLALLDEVLEISDEQAKLQKEEVKAMLDAIINSDDFIRFLMEMREFESYGFELKMKQYKETLKRAQNGEFGPDKNDLVSHFLGNMVSHLEEMAQTGGVFKKVPVRVIKLSEKAILPKYQSIGDAGADIYAAKHTVIEPHSTAIVPTGIAVVIPGGYEIQIRPRSGLSLKTGLRIPNAPGTIDSTYRGEVGVIMENITNEPIVITESMRIAQMVLSEVPKIKWEEITSDEFETLKTSRGAGFGSSGV